MIPTRKYSSQLLIAAIACFGLVACELEQTQEGKLPDVDVSVEAGQMPEYDLDVMEVDVSLTEKTVKVPKVIVVMEEVDVQVPVVDVTMPGKMNEEMMFNVEVEVEGEGHQIDIEDVYLVDGKFWVISRLDMNEQAATDARTRISDRIIVNAPSDFEVRHFIIGEKPAGAHNGQYRFINSRSVISDKLANGQKIYSKSIES